MILPSSRVSAHDDPNLAWALRLLFVPPQKTRLQLACPQPVPGRLLAVPGERSQEVAVFLAGNIRSALQAPPVRRPRIRLPPDLQVVGPRTPARRHAGRSRPHPGRIRRHQPLSRTLSANFCCWVVIVLTRANGGPSSSLRGGGRKPRGCAFQAHINLGSEPSCRSLPACRAPSP